MTRLTKAVRRRVDRESGRPLVVSVCPNGTLGIREHKTRREHLVPLSRVYRLAVEATVEADRRAKAAERDRKRIEQGKPPVRRLVRRGLLS
jgi:hypothetical protein